MSFAYHVVLVAKHVIAICPDQDFQDGWEKLASFDSMEQVEQALLWINSGGHSGSLPFQSKRWWIQPELMEG